MIILLAYALFCVALAYRDARRIYNDAAIHHDQNGMLHGVWFALMLFTTFFTHGWWLLAAFPFVGKLTFDMALNRFRGLPVDYISPQVLQPNASLLDRWEYQVFKSGLTPKIVYACIIITLIILHYE